VGTENVGRATEQQERRGRQARQGRRRRPRRTTLAVRHLGAAALLGGLLTAGVSVAPAQAAGDLQPPVPAPAVVEGFSPYLPQVSCDPVAKPGTLALRAMVLASYGGRDLGIVRSCAVGGLSEHKEGRAWDWGVDSRQPEEKALADRFVGWLTAPGSNGMPGYQARRLGVMYVVWNGRMWSQYRAAEGWRPYTGANPHREHVHFSLTWNGATQRTSWWTGKASATDYGPCVQVQGQPAAPWSGPRTSPCPAPVSAMTLTGTPLLSRGSTGAYVVQLQKLLSVEPVTGFFGPLTEAAVTALQQRAGLPVTGTTPPETWGAARSGASAPPPPQPTQPPAVHPPATSTVARALPARMRYTVRPGDTLGRLAKRWRSTVAAIRSASGLQSDVISVGQRIVIPVRSNITKFTYTALERGDTGVAVKALQTALRMRPKYRTGLFGPITEARVNGLKARRGWRQDGAARTGVWRALGA